MKNSAGGGNKGNGLTTEETDPEVSEGPTLPRWKRWCWYSGVVVVEESNGTP